MTDTVNRPAELLAEGDTIRLTFSGGTEDIEVTHVKRSRSGLIRWRGWNSVTGDIKGALEPHQTVQVVA